VKRNDHDGKSIWNYRPSSAESARGGVHLHKSGIYRRASGIT
jgi:hypothetical protein